MRGLVHETRARGWYMVRVHTRGTGVIGFDGLVAIGA